MALCCEFAPSTTQTCGTSEGGFMYVQMALQERGYYPLTSPDWSNPIALTSPIIMPSIRIEGAPEAGALGMGTITIEAGNEIIHSSGDRFYDIVTGTSQSMPFDLEEFNLHVRFLWKNTSAGTYSVRFWGVVDYKSLTLKVGSFNDPDTWTVRINADDCLSQLEEAEAGGFIDLSFNYNGNTKSPYVAQANHTYITTMGDIAWGSRTYYSGRYLLRNVRYDIGNGIQWMNTPDDDALTINWVKVTSIFDAVSSYFGFEAAVNNGDAWSTRHSWKFYVNNGDSTGTGNTTLWEFGLEWLHFIIYSLITYNPSGSIYRYYTQQTLFDASSGTATNPASLRTCGSVLDLLKRVCTSLGCVASVRTNAAGERYLDIREAAMATVTIDYGEDSYYEVDAEMTPYIDGTSGITVISPAGSDVVRGSNGSESKKIDTIFTVASNARIDADFRAAVNNGASTSGAIHVVLGNSVAHDFWSSLWILSSQLSTNVYDNAYSVCAIQPRNNGNGSTSDAYISNGPGGYEYGAHHSTYGGLTIDGVLYPHEDDPVTTWAEIPAAALAHYYYSPQMSNPYGNTGGAPAYDPLGVYRSRGKSLTLKRAGILDEIPYPGSRITIVMNGVTDDYVVRSVTEDHESNTTEFKCEAWGI